MRALHHPCRSRRRPLRSQIHILRVFGLLTSLLATTSGCRFSTEADPGLEQSGFEADSTGTSADQTTTQPSDDQRSLPTLTTGSARNDDAVDSAAPPQVSAQTAGRASAADGGTPATPSASHTDSAGATAATAGGAATRPQASGATRASSVPAASSAAGADPDGNDAGMDATGRIDPTLSGGGVAPTTLEATCAAELSECLVRDPLDYARCLKINAENGCPESAGTSTGTTTDGRPLSVACSAQLADCIMRNPTPENAAECQEMADVCTL